MRNVAITIAALPDHLARSSGVVPVEWSMGKRFCQHSPSISEDRIKEVLCEKLGLSTFDSDEIKNQVEVILVQSDGSLQMKLQCAEYFEMLPN